MAVIERKDLIDDGALQAPKQLADSFKELLDSLNQIIDTSKGYKKAVEDSDGSTSKIKESTQALNQEQKLLASVQTQIATQTAKQSDEYQKNLAVLKEVTAQTKLKTELGDKDAKAVTAQNASIKELGAALNANRAAYASLTSEEARNSKEGQDLLKVIQQQDAQYKSLKSSIGQNQDNVGNYEGAMRRLKLELKSANDELVHIADTLGEDSKEFKDAALKAGQLRDKIDDTKASVKAVSGTPIENLSGSFSLLQDKVKGLDFKGATSAINGIAQSAKDLTFKEATNGVGAFGQALGGLGKALLTNPVFLISAAIATAVIAFKYFESEAEKLTTNMLARLSREKEALTDRYDHEIKLMQITGEKTYEIELEKQKAIITTSQKAIEAAGDVMKIDLLASLTSMRLVYQVNEEKLKQLKEFTDSKKKAEQEIELIEAKRAADEKKRIEEEAKARKKAADDALASLRRRIELELQYQIANEQKDREKAAREKDQLLQTLEDINKIQTATSNAYNVEEKELNDYGKAYEDWYNKRGTMEKLLADRKKEYLKDEIEGLQKVSNFYSQYKTGLVSIFSNITQERLNEIDAQETALKNQANNEILLAGGNAEAKAQIQAQLDLKLAGLEKKKREEQNKQAKLQRDADIIEAAIKGSLAVLQGLKDGGPILAAVYGALAAIQIAAIASKPLPKYEVGTDNHPGGLAIVGEKGPELISTPDGGLQISPGRATVMDLPRGTEVITAKETLQMLANAGLSASEIRNQASFNDARIVGKLSNIESALKKGNQPNYTKVGAMVYVAMGEKGKYMHRVRGLSMGKWL
ncbi:MAG TPA: hypothetical protein VL443_29925 [Cyclobacteriaceae bacterium]|jgi:hypothetical protein|nr:hypothetical protein [Cyclobacteriaceae bacterium]